MLVNDDMIIIIRQIIIDCLRKHEANRLAKVSIVFDILIIKINRSRSRKNP